MKKLRERFEETHKMNSEYVKDFSGKYQTLKELAERLFLFFFIFIFFLFLFFFFILHVFLYFLLKCS